MRSSVHVMAMQLVMHPLKFGNYPCNISVNLFLVRMD